MILSNKQIRNLIEPHFHQDILEDRYEVLHMKANQLLTKDRVDIAFKLLYLEMMNKNVSFAKNIYEMHIKAFSLGEVREPCNDDKNSLEKFTRDFSNILKSIKLGGFNASKTLIPLSKNNSIANGAHRVASAIFLDKYIDCVKIGTNNHIYDYNFFYKRNISREVLDMVITKFIEHASNVHVAFLWPSATDNIKDTENLIPNIIYKKEIKLNHNGAHNLLSQIYYGEEWLGCVEDDFKGSKAKLVECFKSFDPIRVIVFQADSLDEVLKIKEKIRMVFNIGKHSVHITDTKEEAIRTSRIVFNDNSIHFLNYAKPNKYISTHKKIEKFKEFMIKNELNNNCVLIDSSMILSAYGLREAKDTDYFCVDNTIKYEFDNINMHDEELKYYNENKNEMIYNQKFYFYFNDIKFISFSKLYDMKTARAEIKDRNDCKMMEALIEDNKLKELISKFRQNILYSKVKFRAKIMNTLKNIGLYNILRNTYHSIKGKK